MPARSVFIRLAIMFCVVASACSQGSGTSPTPSESALSPGRSTLSLTFDGRARSYVLYVPSNYTGRTAVPLVIDLHGFVGTAEEQASTSGFLQEADEQGLLVAWPEGVDNSWNGYGCCGNSFAANVDDVGFIRAVVADIRSKGRVNAARIYATGLSNGGGMSHRLGCEAPDLFAGVAPVSFPLNRDGCPGGPPARPLTVVHFHGLYDTTVRYDGSSGVQSAPDSFAAWRSVLGCSGSTVIRSHSNGDRAEQGSGCRSGSRPILYTVSGEHTLYGGQTTVSIADYAIQVFLASGS